MQGELRLDNAFVELKEANRNLEDIGKRMGDTNAEFREANCNLEDAGRRTTETKWMADDAHNRMRSYRDRRRRATKEFEMAGSERMGHLQRTPRGPPTRCRAASQIVTQTPPKNDRNHVGGASEISSLAEDEVGSVRAFIGGIRGG